MVSSNCKRLHISEKRGTSTAAPSHVPQSTGSAPVLESEGAQLLASNPTVNCPPSTFALPDSFATISSHGGASIFSAITNNRFEGCPPKGHLPVDKVDSRKAAEASSGALQTITAYLYGKFISLWSNFRKSSDYLSNTLGVAPGILFSGLAALLALPFAMSRHWPWRRDQSVPYSSPGGVPAVTDEDFSYITSQELADGPSLDSRHHHHVNASSPSSAVLDDDILLIKNNGVTHTARFPAYSIGDGKLRVMDVRERAGLMMELPDRITARLKLLYKGRQLDEPSAPARYYGVKNKSELMAVVPDMGDRIAGSSGEEMVVVDEPSRDDSKLRRRKKRKTKKRSPGGEGDSASSPRDSSSHSKSPPPVAAGIVPMKQIEDLSSEFTTRWLPLCVRYTASPPADRKAREEEHRKLSETLLQNILLKLDGVDTEGVAEVRTKRKELVHRVQEVLKGLDGAAKV
ncbi:hypothetical protein XA68_13857 [Ophiocordyceps unilateralis]|uniref:BAG domain-containing protein n=1 Tax=Ophiocordyceps unilateralis TaxID=268505 RepID=A0A2A9PBT2_OPHUN|nr:hypothetical protein XA68_13857 [Ophiocordyceps unilateralis]